MYMCFVDLEKALRCPVRDGGNVGYWGHYNAPFDPYRSEEGVGPGS